MLNQTSKGFLRNPKFWQIVVLSVTLIAFCQYFGAKTVTNQISGNNSNYSNNNNDNNLLGPSATTNPNSFISTWDTNLQYSGSTNITQIKLPLVSTGQYNFIVQWGDGSSSHITSWNQSAVTHNYPYANVYVVNITGYLKGWEFNNAGDCYKISQISQWGNINLGNSGNYFLCCGNLVLTATDALNLTGTTDLSHAFDACPQLGGLGQMYGWNVSKVTNMAAMFDGATTFNQNIGYWNVSSVTDMDSMFQGDSAFNQDISNWDVSSVTNMGYMFYGDTAFNQSIGDWNISSVTNTEYMFYRDAAFNQPIGNWNVSSVGYMAFMFYGNTAFNQDISNWDVSSVTNTAYMFYGDAAFNQSIGNWNVGNVNSMDYMFYNASSFNQFIGNWNVSSVTTMESMFQFAMVFNQSIGAWNVSSLTNMEYMFYNALAFNQPIGNWDVSSVTNMRDMFFEAFRFNQNIGTWDVSSVTDMTDMFAYDFSFSTDNYGALLNGWSLLNLQENVPFSAGYTQYPAQSQDSHEYLTDVSSWKITDGGLANPITPVLSSIASPSTDGYVELKWSSSQCDLNYTIYRSTSNITTLTGATLIATMEYQNYYQDSGLNPGIYYYVIVGSNGVVNSSISNCESVTVMFKPVAPTSLNATVESSSILLTWEAPSNTVGSLSLYYDIYRADSANGMFNLIGNSSTTSYNDTNVNTGPTYYYKVTAINSAGTSSYSNVANATTSHNKAINGMGIGEILSVSFVGMVVVTITMKKRKNA